MEKPVDTALTNVVHHVREHLEQSKVTPVKIAVYHVTMKRKKDTLVIIKV